MNPLLDQLCMITPLRPRVIAAIRSSCQLIELVAGNDWLRIHRFSKSLAMLVKGSMKCMIRSADHTACAGIIIEKQFIHPLILRPRPTTSSLMVEAMEDCTIIFIEQHDLERLAATYPVINGIIDQLIDEEIDQVADMTNFFSLNTMEERAAYLQQYQPLLWKKLGPQHLQELIGDRSSAVRSLIA